MPLLVRWAGGARAWSGLERASLAAKRHSTLAQAVYTPIAPRALPRPHTQPLPPHPLNPTLTYPQVIGLKWKPAAFLPAPLKAPSSQHRLLIATAGGASWALPNVADLLAEMVEIGGALVKQVAFPRSSQALRRGVLGR